MAEDEEMDAVTTDTATSSQDHAAVMRKVFIRKEIVIAYKKIAAEIEMPFQSLIQRALMDGLERLGYFTFVTPPLYVPPPERALPKLAKHVGER